MTNVLLVAPAVVLIETVSGAITGRRFKAASMAVASLEAFRGPVKSKKKNLNMLKNLKTLPYAQYIFFCTILIHSYLSCIILACECSFICNEVTYWTETQ